MVALKNPTLSLLLPKEEDNAIILHIILSIEKRKYIKEKR
jgi:hypothetical protein